MQSLGRRGGNFLGWSCTIVQRARLNRESAGSGSSRNMPGSRSISIRRQTPSTCAQIAAGAFAALMCVSSLAQNLSAAGYMIDVNSLGRSPTYPGANSVWVLYDTPGMSFECSPPQGCYAKSQRTNYVFMCGQGFAVPVERISYDLGGSVVKHEVQDIQQANTSIYDAGADLVLSTYCRVRYRRHP